ncbi:7976_t:CDS:2 [Entrophospora sp. SA101]|nr:7976_t:CDS:2 [Entrophospora sp. SA101]CAJ0826371.1 6010_t:CDS:2 [Entrophospora sp. SA101]CAJ0902201.1 3251_t:CDS:2 [Entrophospora sp. SA101]
MARQLTIFFNSTRLSLHYNKSGKQPIRFPCTDSEYVAVFGKELNWFSPAKRTYQCTFKGYEEEAITW